MNTATRAPLSVCCAGHWPTPSTSRWMARVLEGLPGLSARARACGEAAGSLLADLLAIVDDYDEPPCFVRLVAPDGVGGSTDRPSTVDPSPWAEYRLREGATTKWINIAACAVPGGQMRLSKEARRGKQCMAIVVPRLGIAVTIRVCGQIAITGFHVMHDEQAGGARDSCEGLMYSSVLNPAPWAPAP